jgi:hypothetical protein
MGASCVLFEVRTEFLNIIYKDFGFKGLKINTDFVKLCFILSMNATLLGYGTGRSSWNAVTVHEFSCLSVPGIYLNLCW